eukprot:COSAG02_NODE_7663_length_2907_cov_2.648860_1_plen_61_part_10
MLAKLGIMLMTPPDPESQNSRKNARENRRVGLGEYLEVLREIGSWELSPLSQGTRPVAGTR